MSSSLTQRADHLNAAAQAANPDLADSASALLGHFYRHVLTEDLLAQAPEDLLGAALSQQSLASQRAEGEILGRAFTPSVAADGWTTGNTVIEIVVDDMPFVVDSLAAELGRQGIAIRELVHPQLPVQRNAEGALQGFGGQTHESWVHIEIAPETDQARLDQLIADLKAVLEDVRQAVGDWQAMQTRAEQLAAELRSQDQPAAADFLNWLVEGNFLFLAYREHQRSTDGFEQDSASNLGVAAAGSCHAAGVLAEAATELLIGKSEALATVHRSAYLDCVAIPRHDENGELVAIRHFHGLFAATAYTGSVTQIPHISQKIQQVLDRSGYAPGGHSARDLLNVLESCPRDEVLEAPVEHLTNLATQVVASQTRRVPRVFIRRDAHGSFVTALAYLPRDRYDTELRVRLQELLLRTLGGQQADFTVQLSDSPMAVVYFVVRGEALNPVSATELEAWLTAAIRTWQDDWEAAVAAELSEADAGRVINLWGAGFDAAYRATYQPRTGVVDAIGIDSLVAGEIGLNLHRDPGAASGTRRLKLYSDRHVDLTDVLPMLLGFGLRVTDERTHVIRADNGERAYVLDFGLKAPNESDWGRGEGQPLFAEAFQAVWRGAAEADSYNQLVLSVGLSWRQVACLRTVASYVQQTTPYSASYIESALVEHAEIAQALCNYFETRLSPDRFVDAADANDRAQAEQQLAAGILSALEQVPSLDHDRIIRAAVSMIGAIERTNFYQVSDRDAAARATPIAVKLDPMRIPHLPQPRPAHEIWVYSPRFEGVHLRFGQIARGGLRWSDRREDFRTEVLGLVKAQMVKNAVIVPGGAKGGFCLKGAADPQTDRETWLAEGRQGYREFIGAMLSITDNLVDGQAVAPANTVRHDDADPYLVVAADKGTASFSDLANEVSQEHDFWLDDAFASGGSSGYDHKAMGITARGAWESVKRHFRELGHDTQTEPFTVVGIGDMSGDVFGNGMLLSEQIKLLAAFDHRHIFVDPNPAPASSFVERQRLAALPRSSWADYDAELISPGGGVFPRTAKSIEPSPEMVAALGLSSAAALTPIQLMQAILTAPVDLVWNGGIGTYIKASTETNAEIGDPGNDSVRVDGRDLRARVVGEGGNLGVSQRGRIEAATKGVLINTDAIDNSGGVDSSDREVNIKILLSHLTQNGELTDKQRGEILASMTDEVADQVLRTNYEQNVLLGNARQLSLSMLGAHERLMQDLVEIGELDRELEALPSTQALTKRRAEGRGLTTPEFAVLTAYSKMWLKDELLATDLADEPWFFDTLADYFPSRLRGYQDALVTHRLKREIIVNSVANMVVNRGGITFVHRALEETGATVAQVVKAFVVCREVYALDDYFAAVERLDGQVSTATQAELYVEARRLIDRTVRYLLANSEPLGSIEDEVNRFRAAASELRSLLPGLLSGHRAVAHSERVEHYVSNGVPAELAAAASGLFDIFGVINIAEIARTTQHGLGQTAEVYFGVAEQLSVNELLSLLNDLPHEERWDALARTSLRHDVYRLVKKTTRRVLELSGETGQQQLAAWSHAEADKIAASQDTVKSMAELAGITLGPVWVALRRLQTLMG